MRASRLLSIMLRLQAHGRISAPEMARDLEVSERTVYRDIDQLSASGIPVIADRGRGGGFRLADGFRTELTGLTEGEAEALVLAGVPAAAADLGLAELVTAARTKLLASLPPGAKAERLAARFHLDAQGWFRGSDDVSALPAIARAVLDARYLRFHYASDGSVYERKVGPLGIVLKGGIWYLVAQKSDRIRTYRVGRIFNAHALEDKFARPAKFDLVAWWTKASIEYERNTYRGTAVVRLSPRGRSLIEALGSYVVAAVAKTATKPDRRGYVRCSIPIEPGETGIRELLRLGGELEVLSPPELRTALAETLRSMLARHAA